MVTTERLELKPLTPFLSEQNKAAEKRLTQMNEANIFISKEGVILTTFGEKVQGVLIKNYGLSIDHKLLPGKQITPEGKIEVVFELKEACEELGLNSDLLPEVGKRFQSLVNKRNAEIASKYPIR